MKRLWALVSLMVVLTLVMAACTSSSPSSSGPAPTPTKQAAVPVSSGLAKAPEGTVLRRIQDRGKLIVGVKYDVPLFGYLNPVTNKVEGFDVALAKEIAKKIFGVDDANVDSKIELKQAVSKDRIPFLQEDVTDLVISTMTINADREKEIDFSVVYYLAGQSLLVPKDSPIKSFDDLNGKKVATAKGSTSEQNLTSIADKKGIRVEPVLFDSYSEGVTAMSNKRADAVTTDDIILMGFASQDKNLQLVGGQFTQEPYGVGIKKGATETVDVVNSVIKELKANGQWKAIFKREVGDKAGVDTPEPPVDNWRDIVK